MAVAREVASAAEPDVHPECWGRQTCLFEGVLFALGYVGLAAQDQGDDRAAQDFLGEAEALGRRLGDRDNLSRALLGLGFLALYNWGDPDAARGRFRESLLLARDLGHPYPLIYSLEGLAGVAAAEGRPERALRLAAAAAALREARRAVPAPQLRGKYECALEPALQALDADARANAWADGEAMTDDEAVVYALADEAEEAPLAKDAHGAERAPSDRRWPG